MFLSVHVNYASYFDNVMLDSITIVPAFDKEGNILISETDPNTPTDNYIFKKVYNEDMQVDNLMIDKGVLDAAFNNWNGERVKDDSKPHARKSFDQSDFSHNLFFVYIKGKVNSGGLDGCLPCELTKEITIGVTYDQTEVYQTVMGYTKELARDCIVPDNFVNYILLHNALNASIETEHFIPALKYWKLLVDNTRAVSPTKNCGCHG